ncbi:hypothetical protein HYN59_11475 [Flavobacterium album]|uniref:Uncharacterized protein n=1 Tax=Flavobacterium album TaxID=2175091 RepID=A0A2S1QZ64_9FLAO|nr:hypothetical protein HYN59_11475 [Flavobacterium album]
MSIYVVTSSAVEMLLNFKKQDMNGSMRDGSGILPRHEGRYSAQPDTVVYGGSTPKYRKQISDKQQLIN